MNTEHEIAHDRFATAACSILILWMLSLVVLTGLMIGAEELAKARSISLSGLVAVFALISSFSWNFLVDR